MGPMLRQARLPLLLLPFALLATAQTLKERQQEGVRGTWRTPGNAVVDISSCGGNTSTVCATLLQLEPNAPTRLDTKNPDASLHNRKLCGLQIGTDFHLTDPDHAEDGHLYDPKSGKTYRGALTAAGNGLDLRGYIGIKAFGRTEHWTRTPTPPSPCS